MAGSGRCEAWLLSTSGQQDHRLRDGRLIVGREPSSADVVVNLTSVSRKHAELRVQGEAVLVLDLDSSNGTYVNGERVSKQQLADGDALAFGDAGFTFSLEQSFDLDQTVMQSDWEDQAFDPDATRAQPPEKKATPRTQSPDKQDALKSPQKEPEPPPPDPAEVRPVGSGAYTFERGDFLEKVAVEQGHISATLWSADKNSPVNKQRQDPDAIWPGDRLAIPKPRQKAAKGYTARRHRFRRKGLPLETDWLEIALVDAAGQPVAGERYRVVNHKGVPVAEGKLDRRGLARVEGLKKGDYRVTFLDLDRKAWRRRPRNKKEAEARE